MLKHIAFTLLLAGSSLLADAQLMGSWTNYMAYSDVQEVADAGTLMYVRASDNLYLYNKGDQSITTYDKVSGLSDCTITHIKWCPTTKQLVIIYDNSNIDLLDTSGDVFNVSDLYSRSMTEDKTVNHVYIYGRWAFLATGFGVVRLNVQDGNISETYRLGMAVAYTYVQDGYLYAASASNGLYRAALSGNPMDKSQWTRVGAYTANTETTDPELLALAKTLKPDGPSYNYFYELNFTNSKLYSSGGYYAVGSNDELTPGTIQVLHQGNWQTYENNIAEKTGYTYVDINCVALDPTTSNTERLFASGRTGLYEFENGQFKQAFNKDNSPLQDISNLGNNYVFVSGLTFDSNGNLWVLNSGTTSTSLFEYTKDKQWVSHHNTALMNNGKSFYTMVRPMFDSRGLLWFTNTHYQKPALVCYNTSTNAFSTYTSFVNQDGSTITLTSIPCVAEDKDHNIWIGTNVGPLYLTQSDITSGSETFNQYKVARDDGSGLADYLLSNVSINYIAIDGGNRKWFATAGNGVYLISSDNNTQICHFTTDNSPLLSNNVTSIAIDGETGIVYFATDKGLCSYKSDATDPSDGMEKDKVYAYPNPTTPGYNGLITVNGLSSNADVKIVSTNGALIAEGRSTGGTFTWNGCDKSGRRVNSGIYMVVTATSDGQKGTVCKLAIVR